jgi:hypothetical protein
MPVDKAGAVAIRNIIKAESIKEMQRQLKSLNKGNIDAGITTVKAPTNGDYSTEYCKTIDRTNNCWCIFWWGNCPSNSCCWDNCSQDQDPYVSQGFYR